jgi:hypothetical protein
MESVQGCAYLLYSNNSIVKMFSAEYTPVPGPEVKIAAAPAGGHLRWVS